MRKCLLSTRSAVCVLRSDFCVQLFRKQSLQATANRCLPRCEAMPSAQSLIAWTIGGFAARRSLQLLRLGSLHFVPYDGFLGEVDLCLFTNLTMVRCCFCCFLLLHTSRREPFWVRYGHSGTFRCDIDLEPNCDYSRRELVSISQMNKRSKLTYFPLFYTGGRWDRRLLIQ